MAHAVALLSSMQAMKKDRRYNKSQASAFLILGVIFVGPMLSSALNRRQTVQWFGETSQNSDFILLSVVMFLVWAVVGISRLMRTELQMRNGPFVWLAFTIFFAVFFTGFVDANNPRELIFHRFFVAYAVMLSLTYLMAFSERKDPVAFRRLISAYGRRDWSRVMQELPCWAVTLPPALVAGGGMFVTVTANMVSLSPITDVRMFTAAMFLFLLRDLGLLLFFNLARNPKRADMIAVLCLGLLYGVVPGIVTALHFDSITSLFWPGWKNHSFLSVVAAAIEAVLIHLLVFKRWRAHYGR